MITIKDKKLGECEIEVFVPKLSAVDAYALDGYSVTLDRVLTNNELDYVTDRYAGEIQEYAYNNGSRNHN